MLFGLAFDEIPWGKAVQDSLYFSYWTFDGFNSKKTVADLA